jgi:hypothetical protein
MKKCKAKQYLAEAEAAAKKFAKAIEKLKQELKKKENCQQ